MRVRDCMTKHVIAIGADEPAAEAARLMSRYRLGALPVRSASGRLCGMVTDRDLVVRCIAAGKPAAGTPVSRVMSPSVLSVEPSADAAHAAQLMARAQLRRLPVAQNGYLTGIVTLADLARLPEGAAAAGSCLGAICAPVVHLD